VLSFAATGASDNLTAIATLVLAGITLALVFATIWLVLSTRGGTAEARADAKAELKVLERQVGSGYRPLLVDVLTIARAPEDMGGKRERVRPRAGPGGLDDAAGNGAQDVRSTNRLRPVPRGEDLS